MTAHRRPSLIRKEPDSFRKIGSYIDFIQFNYELISGSIIVNNSGLYNDSIIARLC